jgi:coenzyme F420-reducing hydrogenase delta subunit
MLPPSFIDFTLSRDHADGVFITGCRHGECQNRLGVRWTEERLAGTRDPALRKRVPRDRLTIAWAAPTEQESLEQQIADFAVQLAALPKATPPKLPEIEPAVLPVQNPAGTAGDD